MSALGCQWKVAHFTMGIHLKDEVRGDLKDACHSRSGPGSATSWNFVETSTKMTRTFLRFFSPYQPLPFPVVFLSIFAVLLISLLSVQPFLKQIVLFSALLNSLPWSILPPTPPQCSMPNSSYFLSPSKQLVKLLPIFCPFYPLFVTIYPISYWVIPPKHLRPSVRLRGELSWEASFLTDDVFQNSPMLWFHMLTISP